MLFQKWLNDRGKRSRLPTNDNNGIVPYNSSATNTTSSNSRGAALMLLHHFDTTNRFVGSLFGLEQWLRDQFIQLVRIESLYHCLRIWAGQSGVSSQARLHFDKRMLSKGWERLQDYTLRSLRRRRTLVYALSAGSRRATTKRRRGYSSGFASIFASSTVRDSVGDIGSVRGSGSGLFRGSSSGAFPWSSSGLAQSLSEPEGINGRRALFGPVKIGDKSMRIRLLLESRNEAAHFIKTIRSAYSTGVHVTDADLMLTHRFVFLSFCFRRLYHRTLLRRRFKRVAHTAQNLAIIVPIFAMWRAAADEMIVETQSRQQPLVEQCHYTIGRMRLYTAFQRMRSNVKEQRGRDRHIKAFERQLRSNRICVRAVNIVCRPCLVKCFLALQTNYSQNDILANRREQRRVMTYIHFTHYTHYTHYRFR